MAIDNIPLSISENMEEIEINIDDTSHPYYVGARACVTQTADLAIVTVIDKEGTTTAVLLDGNQGRITDITYDPDTMTIKKVNGVVIEDLVTLSDVIDNWVSENRDLVVPDGSLTEEKLSDELRLLAIKDYVTPEMFGAVGDGVTDDSEAIQTASEAGTIYGSNRT